MILVDIASIVFVCVTANHLGLVKALEEKIQQELPIINCTKCLTCWTVFFYMVLATRTVIPSLAISFLSSYIALWLEMLEAYIDTLYMKLYEEITTTDTYDTPSADAKHGNSASTMP